MVDKFDELSPATNEGWLYPPWLMRGRLYVVFSRRPIPEYATIVVCRCNTARCNEASNVGGPADDHLTARWLQ